MEKILVVSSNKTASEALVNFLRDSFRCTPKLVESAYQAKTVFDADPSVELAVINSPLMDESGVEFAEYVTGNTPANCILFVKSEAVEKLGERAEKAGIIIVGKPFSKTVLYQIVRTVDIAVSRSAELYLRNACLEEKINEIKLINRAKLLLMEREGISEENAHKLIEKTAMETRSSKKAIAEQIVSRYKE